MELHKAVLEMDWRKTRQIVREHREIINYADSDGNTLLHLAMLPRSGTKDDQIRTINVLLDYDVDVHIKNSAGQTPFDLCNDFEMLKFLLWDDIHTTSQIKKESRVAKSILRKEYDWSGLKEDDNSTPLMYAATGVDLELVQILVEAKGYSIFDQDDDGCTVLIYSATDGGDVGIMQYLLKKSAELVDPGEYKKYIEKKDKGGDNAVLHAVKNSHFDVMKLLIESGADMSPHDSRGLTPLVIIGNGLSRADWMDIRKELNI